MIELVSEISNILINLYKFCNYAKSSNIHMYIIEY